MAMDHPDRPEAIPVIRISERERDDAAQQLARYCSEGRLTLEEFSERVEVVLAARTQTEIDQVMQDLPTAPVPATQSNLPATGRITAVLSGTERKGRWRPRPHTKVTAILGGIAIDLRNAQIEGSELRITAVAFMGGIDVIVPEGVTVHLEGWSFMGGKDLKLADVPPLPGSPVITVRAHTIMGGVSVRTKRPRVPLRERLTQIDVTSRDQGPHAAGSHRPRTSARPRDPVLDMRDGLALAAEIIDKLSGKPATPGSARTPASRSMATAPDGTVTILFCDVSGFTEMTERLGDIESQHRLTTYFKMVRAETDAHGGYEVKRQGDEVMLAFSGASQAIRCAIDIQRALARHCSLNPDEEIRAHVGLHTGEALQDGGDFLGRTVILASRITDEAQVNEILVSSLLHELASGSGDLRFGDAREVTLQGVSAVQRLFPVLWD
jgi:class 3 adenylate cyclase